VGRAGKGRGATPQTLLPGEELGVIGDAAAVKTKIHSGGSSGMGASNSRQVLPSDTAAAYAPGQGKAGDQSYLWQAEMDQSLNRGLGLGMGDEEKIGDAAATVTATATMTYGNNPVEIGGGGITRQDSNASLVSDMSSGEVLQLHRYPPTEEINNEIFLEPMKGLFLPHEKRYVFQQAMAVVFDEEARVLAAKSDPEKLLNSLMMELRAGLEDASERTERQLQQLASLLGLGGDTGAGFPNAGMGGAGFINTNPGGLRVGFREDSQSVMRM